MAINSIGGLSEPQNTSSVEKTEEQKNTQRTVTYTANGVTKTVDATEDDLQSLEVDEENSEEKIYNDKMDNCEKQLETLRDQLKELERQLDAANQQLYRGGDTAAINQQKQSIRQNINSVNDNINKVYLTMRGYETDLEASTMDFMNGGSVDPTSFKFREGATAEGKNVISTAAKYDDKSADEMAGIMQNAGYRYHGGAWCADFVTFALGQAYGKDNVPGNFINTCANTSYCPEIVNWAKGNNSWTTDPNTLQPGDMVLFDWDGDGTADHVGLFASLNSDGTISTIEGNTSGAAGGSCVETKIRDPKTILGYSRLSGLS